MSGRTGVPRRAPRSARAEPGRRVRHSHAPASSRSAKAWTWRRSCASTPARASRALPESEAARLHAEGAGRGPDRRQPALRHQRDLERHHAQRHAQPDQHGGAARAQGRDRERRAHGCEAEEGRGSITWSRRARSSTTAGSRKTCTARCSPRSRRRRSSCSRSIWTRSRPRSITARSPIPITGETRPADERFLRSVEEKIKVSDSGKLSFRQEVVRKAMVAYKAGEKFTLDSHARMREAIEQYLFEERRDVLRLVTSTARPDDEARQKISVGAAAPGQRIRLRRAQRQGSAELRHDAARTGVARLTAHREYERRPWTRSAASATTAGANGWYELFSRGARDWLRHNEKVREAVREHLPRDHRRRRRDQRAARARCGCRCACSSTITSGCARPRSSRASGQGKAKPGDVFCRAQSAGRGPGQKGARRQATTAASQCMLEFKVDDIVDWLWEEMQLPNLKARVGPVRGERLGARRLGPARRALAARPAALHQGVGQAPRQPRAPRRPSPTTTCASASWHAASSRRCRRWCSCMLDVSGSMSDRDRKLAKTFFFWAVQGLRRQYRSARDGVRRAHHRGLGVQRAGVLPGERQRRHRGLDRASQGARDHRRALQPRRATTSISSTPPTATTPSAIGRRRAQRAGAIPPTPATTRLPRSLLGVAAPARHRDRRACSRSSPPPAARRQLRA